MKLNNKVILITGGGSGIGKAMALGCIESGGEVIIVSRSANKPNWINEYPNIYYYQGDVCNPESIKSVIDVIINHHGKVDVLVNNAGINKDNLFINMDYDEWNEVIQTNLSGPYICTKALLPHFINEKSGKIINISSAAASRVNIGQANYCSAKAGLEMFTKVLAIELPRYGDITANCIQPGVFEEGMGENLMKMEKVWKKYKSRFALGRPGKGKELADCLVFLASSESSYINGHILEVNGGLLWG